MNTSVQIFKELDEALFFWLDDRGGLIYESPAYLLFLKQLLNCEICYLVSKNEFSDICGVLPVAVSQHARLGTVANSLPFYGSYGGIILDQNLSDTLKNQIRGDLISSLNRMAHQELWTAQTLIAGPLDPSTKWYESHLEYDYKDFRIGQLTDLPSPEDNVAEALLSHFEDPRPRNIRRAQKAGINIAPTQDPLALSFLYEVHCANMNKIGGLAKPKLFFDLIPKLFSQEQYKVYVAEKEGKPIAALLLLYGGGVVEYFVPATIWEYRNDQPLSLLIFEAMKDASNEGFQTWNWGGTWATQDGVYHFKKKWAARDIRYFYYTKIHDAKVLMETRETLLSAHPFFYVAPFSELKLCSDKD